MIYFTADWHLRHKNVIKYCDRPFDNVEDMNELILHNYIDIICPHDTVFFNGDLTIKRNSKDKVWMAELFSQLPGSKHLIIGNHDYYQEDFYLNKCGFKSVQRYIQTKDYAITHNPKDFKNKDILGTKILIHGHVHSNYPVMEFNDLAGLNGEYTYDCGVDANNFKPVSLKYIQSFFKGGYTRLQKDFSFSQKR